MDCKELLWYLHFSVTSIHAWLLPREGQNWFLQYGNKIHIHSCTVWWSDNSHSQAFSNLRIWAPSAFEIKAAKQLLQKQGPQNQHQARHLATETCRDPASLQADTAYKLTTIELTALSREYEFAAPPSSTFLWLKIADPKGSGLARARLAVHQL